MFADDKDGANLREELGLTVERGKELLRITQSIMDQCLGDKERGRISHVLLHIAGRKDLNEVEKAVCIFIFACKTVQIPTNMESSIQDMNERPTDMPRVMDIDMGGFRGHISGMVVAPQGVELEELTAVVMATLMSLIRQMPKNEAQDFCRCASISLAKMAFTRDMKP